MYFSALSTMRSESERNFYNYGTVKDDVNSIVLEVKVRQALLDKVSVRDKAFVANGYAFRSDMYKDSNLPWIYFHWHHGWGGHGHHHGGYGYGNHGSSWYENADHETRLRNYSNEIYEYALSQRYEAAAAADLSNSISQSEYKKAKAAKAAGDTKAQPEKYYATYYVAVPVQAYGPAERVPGSNANSAKNRFLDVTWKGNFVLRGNDKSSGRAVTFSMPGMRSGAAVEALVMALGGGGQLPFKRNLRKEADPREAKFPGVMLDQFLYSRLSQRFNIGPRGTDAYYAHFDGDVQTNGVEGALAAYFNPAECGVSKPEAGKDAEVPAKGGRDVLRDALEKQGGKKPAPPPAKGGPQVEDE